MNLCDLICFRVFSARTVHVLKWDVLSVMPVGIPYAVYGIPSPTDLQLIASNCEQASRKPNARRVFSSALHISAMFIINELSLSLVSVCKSSGNYSASLAARK